MCRLMGFVSDHEETISNIAGPAFADFTALSAKHGDGWGVAATPNGASPSVILEPTRAQESPLFASTATNLQSDGALLHLRWATLGLDINEGNTHPFTYENMSFIHNGSITPPSSLDRFIDPSLKSSMRGETDSEKYFFAIVTAIKQMGLREGILAAVRTIAKECDYSSINAMIMTPDYYFTICEHNNSKIPENEGPDYYHLAYRVDDRGLIVASSGWDQSDWIQIPNHQLMEVKRATLESTITQI